jgi:ubiquinone biosynthesis protein Coq4
VLAYYVHLKLFAMNKNLDYKSSLTLAEALRNMRISEVENNLANVMPANIFLALEQHDAIHILFNCGTSIQDEIAVHIWMVCATTANLREMHRAVTSQEHRNVLSGIGHFKLLGIWLTSLPRIIGIVFKSLQMKKKLVVEDLSQLKEKTVFEIRQELGIAL